MDKVVDTAAEPVADIPAGALIAAGGSGICGIPAVLIDTLVERGITDLEIISNNCETDGVGLGKLLENKQIRRVVASNVGENKELAHQFLSGANFIDADIELVLQSEIGILGTGPYPLPG
jgi:acyl CoA:acetate/3-ketoacid CoA transferase alpha subunit